MDVKPQPNQPHFYAKCRVAAEAKLLSKAASSKVQVDMTTLKLSDVDNRWYNPSKYMWWTAGISPQNANKPAIQVMTQATGFGYGKCF